MGRGNVAAPFTGCASRLLNEDVCLGAGNVPCPGVACRREAYGYTRQAGFIVATSYCIMVPSLLA